MYDEFRAKLLAIHDGDTFTLLIDQGFYSWTEQRIRLQGIDTPELKQAGGKESREFTVNWFATHASPYCLLVPEKASTGIFTQTFARFVGGIFSPDYKRDLAADLSAAGHVKPTK
jgi:hypothetical protein